MEFYVGIRKCLELGDKYFVSSQSAVLMQLALLYLDCFRFFQNGVEFWKSQQLGEEGEHEQQQESFM